MLGWSLRKGERAASTTHEVLGTLSLKPQLRPLTWGRKRVGSPLPSLGPRAKKGGSNQDTELCEGAQGLMGGSKPGVGGALGGRGHRGPGKGRGPKGLGYQSPRPEMS